jgi:hypothetical protein
MWLSLEAWQVPGPKQRGLGAMRVVAVIMGLVDYCGVVEALAGCLGAVAALVGSGYCGVVEALVGFGYCGVVEALVG